MLEASLYDNTSYPRVRRHPTPETRVKRRPVNVGKARHARNLFLLQLKSDYSRTTQ